MRARRAARWINPAAGAGGPEGKHTAPATGADRALHGLRSGADRGVTERTPSTTASPAHRGQPGPGSHGAVAVVASMHGEPLRRRASSRRAEKRHRGAPDCEYIIPDGAAAQVVRALEKWARAPAEQVLPLVRSGTAKRASGRSTSSPRKHALGHRSTTRSSPTAGAGARLCSIAWLPTQSWCGLSGVSPRMPRPKRGRRR